VIVIVAHLKDGFIISEEDFICGSFSTVQFFFLDLRLINQKSFVPREMDLLMQGMKILLGIEAVRSKGGKYGKEVCIASALRPNVGFLQIFRDRRLASAYRPMFSVIDEGFGNYVSKRVWGLADKLDRQKKGQKQFEFVQLLRTKVLEVSYNLLKIMAVKYIGTEYRLLFNNEEGKLISNESVVSSYKGIIARRAEGYEVIEKTRPIAVIITQPFSEYRQISLTYELDLIETVIDILIQRDFHIIMKPHPREIVDKYIPILTKRESELVELSNQKMLIEDLFPELDPACVIGILYMVFAVIRAGLV